MQSSFFDPFGFSDIKRGTGMAFTTYNRPSAAVTSGLQSLVENYNRAYGEARAMNEARYRQMLDIANQTTQQRMADVRTSYGAQSANAMQQLARLGMSNTTVAPTLQAGIAREREASLSRVADEMQQTKLGILDKMKVATPDATALQSIIAGVGAQYGGGQGLSTMLKALAGINY